jgi:phospholipid transport system substrate-binding protein
MKKLFSFTLAAMVAFTSVNAAAADCSSPEKYVQSLSNEVVAVIQGGAADSAKEAQLTNIFKRIVDTNWMGKFVLGRNWKSLTPDQQSTYLSKYSEYLVASYVPTFRRYSGEKINIGGSTNLEKEGEFNVNTTIARPGKESVVVNYRVRKDGSCYKVTDIVAEGISLINTQRQDFGAVFARKGYDGLIESLNRKIAAPATAGTPASAN